MAKDKRIFKQPGCKYWYIRYYHNGKRYIESTRTTEKQVAKAILDNKIGGIARGETPGQVFQKTKVNDLVELYKRDYEDNNRKTMKECKHYSKLISEDFGEFRAVDVGSRHIREYRDKRRLMKSVRCPNGINDSTINRELSALRRMYHLGMQEDPPLVLRVPKIKLLKENNIRKGFFELEDFKVLRAFLPDHLKIPATIGFYTGMRLGEILNLKWSNVDFEHQTISLDPGTTKPGEGREVPMIGEIYEALDKWRMKTVEKWPKTPWVCHYNGIQTKWIKRAWRTACKNAGFHGAKFHDFRRSAVRNLVRAGIPKSICKEISGHITDSVFERYDIGSSKDKELARKMMTQYFNKLEEHNRHKNDIKQEQTA